MSATTFRAGEVQGVIFRLTSDPRLTLDPELAGHFRKVKITNVVNAYKAQIYSEFRSLPETARTAFKSIEYYLHLRPYYYRDGYKTPFETIFSRIVPGSRTGPGSFLGKDVDQGLHEELAPKLADVERTLNSWEPGLASRVAKEIKSILGFQPRLIGGSSKLSNHAWGLAIDIDAYQNPQIKDPSVKNVLLKVT